MGRKMTADELEQFERETIHHEKPAAETGPASEAEVIKDQITERQPREIPIPPNPD
jgi:hypothetical protein